jgi:hypothetical protein
MSETVNIAPLGQKPGLIAYECSKCGYITSVFQPADHP